MFRLMLLLSLAAGVVLPRQATAEMLADIRASGVLKAGMAEMPPWLHRNEKGDLVGLEVDMMQRLATDLGVKLQIVVLPFDGLVPKLAARGVDIIASDLSITPERALQVAFTQPYGTSEIEPVIRVDRFPDDVTTDALNKTGVKVGAALGTTPAAAAVQHFPLATFKDYPSVAAASKALVAGEIDALVASSPLPDLLVQSNPDALALLEEDPLQQTVEALAIPQGEPVFLTFLNNWIDAVNAEGFIESSRQQWSTPEIPAAGAQPPDP
ncbi:MAG: transporter substrate-binding domain-containing protein [Geminicoccaceae bacterium]